MARHRGWGARRLCALSAAIAACVIAAPPAGAGQASTTPDVVTVDLAGPTPPARPGQPRETISAAIAAGVLYAVRQSDGAVLRLDPKTATAETLGSLGPRTDRTPMATFAGDVWILARADDGTGTLYRIDTRRRRLGPAIPVGEPVGNVLAAGARSLWTTVSSPSEPLCGRPNPTDPEVCYPFVAGSVASLSPKGAVEPTDIALGRGSALLGGTAFEVFGNGARVWAVVRAPGGTTQSFVLIDEKARAAGPEVPLAGLVTRQSLPAAAPPVHAAGNDALWLLDARGTDAGLVRVDARTGTPTAIPLTTPFIGGGLTVVGADTYLGSGSFRHGLYRYDARTGTLEGCQPRLQGTTVLADAKAIWTIEVSTAVARAHRLPAATAPEPCAA